MYERVVPFACAFERIESKSRKQAEAMLRTLDPPMPVPAEHPLRAKTRDLVRAAISCTATA